MAARGLVRYGLAMAHTYRASQTADASEEAAWMVLSDTTSYPTWNPLTPRVEGPLVVKGKLVLRVALAGWRFPMHATVVRAQPGELAWRVAWPLGLIQALRVQRTFRRDDGRTEIETSETIGGWLSPIVHMLFGGWLASALAQWANAACLRASDVERRLTHIVTEPG
jgi:hypothetical protein